MTKNHRSHQLISGLIQGEEELHSLPVILLNIVLKINCVLCRNLTPK
jgi:hypothetical protein